jgi:hypothetical protein
MLENTERAIKNGQSRETGNIWAHKTQDDDKQNKHNMGWTPLSAKKHK